MPHVPWHVQNVLLLLIKATVWVIESLIPILQTRKIGLSLGSFWNRQTVPKKPGFWVIISHCCSGKREIWWPGMIEENVCISPAQGLGCVWLTSPVTFWTSSAFSQSQMGKCPLSQGLMRIPFLCVPLFPSPPPFFPTGVWVSITCQIPDKPWKCSLKGVG